MNNTNFYSQEFNQETTCDTIKKQSGVEYVNAPEGVVNKDNSNLNYLFTNYQYDNKYIATVNGELSYDIVNGKGVVNKEKNIKVKVYVDGWLRYDDKNECYTSIDGVGRHFVGDKDELKINFINEGKEPGQYSVVKWCYGEYNGKEIEDSYEKNPLTITVGDYDSYCVIVTNWT